MKKGAYFSEDKKYRYKLWRIWDETKPQVGFIGLNPSLADFEKDDPTILKLISLSKNWGYGGLTISNLFAYISKYPKELVKVNDPVGNENNKYIIELIATCDIIVLMWGNSGTLFKRNLEVMDLLSQYKLFCVSTTKLGNPIHPLYKRGDSPLESYVLK